MAYNNFLGLLKDSKIVLTDSGGLQIETSALGIPVSLEKIRRPLTLEKGTNNLLGLDKKEKKTFYEKMNAQKIKRNLKVWDGNSADRIVKKLLSSYKFNEFF